jgi:hypothetical protein
MKVNRSNQNRGERGYAVLLAIFMVATMVLLAAAATPNILIQGRRLREQEVIWRGNQYVRAIRLYYQKNRKYPASLEDLTMANAAGVHFLRKAYKDPMNSADGNWRLIYVTLPAGQLVGSVHFHNLQEMAVASAFAGQMMGSVTGIASQLFGQVNPNLSGGKPFSGPGQPSAQPGQPNGFQPGQSGQGSTQPASQNAVDSPVFGGFVIGVASKVKQPSLMVYQGSKTYYEWEFIWNPLINGNGGAPLPGQVGGVQGANTPGQPEAATNPSAPGDLSQQVPGPSQK